MSPPPSSSSPADVLQPLIAPASVGIVGVSAADPASWGHRVVRVLLDGGYAGEAFVVHPRTPFPGVTTVASIAERPGTDLVVICVPARAALGVVREARAAGARAVIVFASEFAELGDAGVALQDELVEAAGPMLMLGPNCFGVSNRIANVKISAAPFMNRPLRPPGPVALVAQSGALGLVLSRCVEEAGLGYSHFVSAGNEATLTASRIALGLLERPEVRIVLLYLETLRDPPTLARAAMRAAELGKRIVVLAGGRSAAGQRAALSHTAAIGGNDAYLQALCRDFGIVRLRDDEQVKPVLAALERGWTLPPRPRIAVLSNSGGAGTVLADRMVDEGARVEPLSDATRAAIAQLGLVGAGDRNPIDIGGGWEAVLERVPPALQLLVDSGEVDALLVYFAFGDGIAARIAPLVHACAGLPLPACFIWQIAPPEGLPLVETPGVLATTMGEGVRMLQAQMAVTLPRCGRWVQGPLEGVALPAVAPGQRTLAEVESAALLRSLGVAMVESLDAAPDDLPALVDRAGARGWARMVVKVSAHDVPHRHRHGLVRLGVQPQELEAVLQEMVERARAVTRDPGWRLVVQPMVAFDAELAVGGLRDERYGPLLMVGPGGVDIESATGRRDTLLLSTDAATQAAFARDVETRLGLAEGALGPVIAALARLLATPGLTEVDLNPMVRTPAGQLLALDALLVLAPAP